MRLDRKLLLIAPTAVLILVAAGLLYTAAQLRTLANVTASFRDGDAFIAAVERGEKPLETRQAIGILRYSLDMEAKRTAAIVATRDLVIALSAIALVSCGVLLVGIRSVPRQHWPRFRSNESRSG